MMQAEGDGGGNRERFALNELRDRVDGDDELMREVLAVYLEDTPMVLDSLRQALEAGATESAAKAAHTLKGSSANVAAERLRSQAYALEQKARAGDLAEARRLFTGLQSEFQALQNMLNQYLA